MSQSNRINLAQLFVQESEGVYRTAKPEEVVGAALRITERRFRKGVSLTTPSVAREYLALRLAALEHEVFGVLFLDAQSQLIEYQELFRGTATQTSVYPREVVKAALATNAVGAILVHKPPIGVAGSESCGRVSHADIEDCACTRRRATARSSDHCGRWRRILRGTWPHLARARGELRLLSVERSSLLLRWDQESHRDRTGRRRLAVPNAQSPIEPLES